MEPVTKLKAAALPISQPNMDTDQILPARFLQKPRAENFGNTVQEALGHGTPVITTNRTPWGRLPDAGCGWIASCTVDSLRQQLEEALALPPEQLKEMGRKGQEYIEREFSLDSVIDKQIATYRWLLGGASPGSILIQ